MAPPSGPPSDFTPHPTLQPVTEPLFEFPESYSKFPLAIYFTYDIVNFYITLSIHLPFSLLSSHCVHRSVLSVCFSIAALKINSSVPSLQIPFMCVSIRYFREGNGNPLQYSCLENPVDRGTWWAAGLEVAQSDTAEAT